MTARDMQRSTVCATARNAEIRSGTVTGKSENDPLGYLGNDASWEQRRLFDWTYTAAYLRRIGQCELAAYADLRAKEFLK